LDKPSDGPYLFRRRVLDQVELVARRSAGGIGFELAAKAHRLGLSIGTVEIECLPRRSGSSKVLGVRAVADYLAELWRIRRSMNRDP
jgi:hypothetical protein